MTDDEIFCEFYKCKIEITDKKTYVLPRVITHIGQTNNINVCTEPIIGIYLPESMASELIQRTSESIREFQLVNKHPDLQKLYWEYKMWLELKR